MSWSLFLLKHPEHFRRKMQEPPLFEPWNTSPFGNDTGRKLLTGGNLGQFGILRTRPVPQSLQRSMALFVPKQVESDSESYSGPCGRKGNGRNQSLSAGGSDFECGAWAWIVPGPQRGGLTGPGQALRRDRPEGLITAADSSGMPVLTHAARQGHLAAVTSLLSAKANVHARDGSLCTALHYSAHSGNAEVAKALLQAGASAFARNISGATPRDVALMRWAPRIHSDAFESEERREAQLFYHLHRSKCV
eukprot:g16082.t1